jgi:nucleoside phosphorylase
MAVLVVAAAREELGELDGHVLGVGPVVAAVRAATLIGLYQPTRVVMIGTGGAYGGGPPIGEAIVASRVGWSYGVAAMGLGYVPRPPQPVEADPALLDRLPLARHPVLTVGAVTTDPTLASRLSDGWSVEHLEAYGVAFACRESGVPFVVVLGISNVVGPDAHIQWLTHRDAAQDAARAAIAPLLDGEEVAGRV